MRHSTETLRRVFYREILNLHRSFIPILMASGMKASLSCYRVSYSTSETKIIRCPQHLYGLTTPSMSIAKCMMSSICLAKRQLQTSLELVVCEMHVRGRFAGGIFWFLASLAPFGGHCEPTLGSLKVARHRMSVRGQAYRRGV